MQLTRRTQYGVVWHRGSCLPLLLALILAFTPLLAAAQPAAAVAAPADAPVNAMPCHGGQGQLDAGSRIDPRQDCPHCNHDGPLSQCHCANALTLAVVADRPLAHVLGCGAAAPLVRWGGDPLPDSPTEALYRPPACQR